MNIKIILSVVAIIIVFSVVFLSQQPQARGAIENFLSYINKYAGASLIGGLNLSSSTKNSSTGANGSDTNNTNASNTDSSNLAESGYNSSNVITYTAKGVNWTLSSIPEKVIEGLKSGGETLSNNVNNAENKISENISGAEKNVVNYFSGISDAVQNKQNNSCTTQPQPTPAAQ